VGRTFPFEMGLLRPYPVEASGEWTKARHVEDNCTAVLLGTHLPQPHDALDLGEGGGRFDFPVRAGCTGEKKRDRNPVDRAETRPPNTTFGRSLPKGHARFGVEPAPPPKPRTIARNCSRP